MKRNNLKAIVWIIICICTMSFCSCGTGNDDDIVSPPRNNDSQGGDDNGNTETPDEETREYYIKVTCPDCGGDKLCPNCHGSGTGCKTCNGTGQYICSICGGSGTCEICNGSGNCYSCNGTGYKKCLYCNGDKSCHVCDGRGVIYSSGSSQKCSTCNGNGKCTYCGATGKEDCSICGIYEKGKCKYCHGNGACSTCNGNSTCRNCGGDGHCTTCNNRDGKCVKCQGKGYVWVLQTITLDLIKDIGEISKVKRPNSSNEDDYIESCEAELISNLNPSWGIPNNRYVCFTPTTNVSSFSVTYRVKSIKPGSKYKLHLAFSPETRDGYQGLPSKIGIVTTPLHESYNKDTQGHLLHYSDQIVSGTEITTLESDNVIDISNGLDITINTQVSSSDIRNHTYTRTLRISEIQLTPEQE